ncbi:MAG: hypothetical protein ACTHV8_10640 [Nesterenkonia sp.]
MSKRRKKARGNQAAQQSPQSKRGIPAPTPGEHSSPRMLVYALLAVSVFIGLYLHAYALPQLTYFADGLTMPDTRITGYSAADITALRGALESEAAGQLNFLHKTAGIIFPVAVFLATWATFGLLARGTWRWTVVAGAGLFAVVDIAENFLIDEILVQQPLEAALVSTASVLTTLSWGLLMVIGVVLVVFVLRDIVLAARRPSHQSP